MIPKGTKKPLGVVLVEQGFVSEDQLSIALQEQKQTNKPLGKTLIELGFVTDAIIRDVLSENIGQTSVDLTHTVVDAEKLKYPLAFSTSFNRLF